MMTCRTSLVGCFRRRHGHSATDLYAYVGLFPADAGWLQPELKCRGKLSRVCNTRMRFISHIEDKGTDVRRNNVLLKQCLSVSTNWHTKYPARLAACGRPGPPPPTARSRSHTSSSIRAYE
eukprot:scaffold612491_cov43-Prasinocladus_malaysianus.AAC.1